MSIFEKFLSTLFPDHCVGCSQNGTLLCSRCFSKLAPAPSPEHPFITSIFAYAEPRIRNLIRLLKYKNTRHAAQLFGAPLAAALTEFLGEEQLFLGSGRVLLVPIPLSRERRKFRGYNQAELLAKEMLKHLPPGAALLSPGLLEKTIDTASQADIRNRRDRLINLGDCFRADICEGVPSDTIVLIDDVTTTGATLIAARNALRRAGYSHIHACTVAH